jgi:trimeric autotransporter adhesin
MRRFFTLVVLFLAAIPFGVSVSGCRKTEAPTFCNGGDSGLTTGVATTITLIPKIYGISLNYAEIGQLTTPTATDCKGAGASVKAYIYGTTDMTIADVQPTTGRLCGGTWNRNTGAGIPDYTYCNPTNKSGTAYISASADGVTSNPLPVFVHPVVTSVVLGGPSSNCTTDPTTACCPLATVGVVTAAPYLVNSCQSQGTTAQLVARVFAGTGANQTNISCLAGHLQFGAQTSSIVSIDQNGVATAAQPGSTLISANVANAASSAGYFSTCPPATIVLSANGATTNPVPVNLNNPQALTATIFDTNGVALTGLSLEYVSTAPSTIPAGPTVTPQYAGAGSIHAICQPASCNPASYSQIGLFGNGTPVISNSVNFTTPGTNSTVLYMASTQSLDVVPMDFTSNVEGEPFQLPYTPNSMVISNDGSTIYMGSSDGLMVLSAANSIGLTRTDVTSTGTVLALSPDNSTIVLTDPVRQTVTLENSSGSVLTTFGGVGTHAVWAPDSQTVYITTGTVTTPASGSTPAVIAPADQVLVYSNNTGWTPLTDSVPATDVAVTVPSAGAYFAGSVTTARGYCPISTPSTANGVTSESNAFYPPADSSPVTTDRIAATNNGLHILGATVTPSPTLYDLLVNIPTGACPLPPGGTSATVTTPSPGLTFSNTPSTTVLTPVTATAITGVIPSSDSAFVFVTYLGSGGVLPAYAPAANGTGLTTYIKLTGTATAPIAGVGSTDNTVFYVGTSGDNLVHIINRSTLTDSSTLAPGLVNANGVVVPVNLMVQKPRKTT